MAVAGDPLGLRPVVARGEPGPEVIFPVLWGRPVGAGLGAEVVLGDHPIPPGEFIAQLGPPCPILGDRLGLGRGVVGRVGRVEGGAPPARGPAARGEFVP